MSTTHELSGTGDPRHGYSDALQSISNTESVNFL